MNTTNLNLIQKVNSVTDKPGIYKYFNALGEIIYVGKAKNLRNRVKSYFFTKLDRGSKTEILVSQIVDIVTIETLSEFEALILEAELIKKHRPKYNISLKDDKSYLYIVVRTESVQLCGRHTQLPKIIVARKSDLLPKDVTFGPFPGSNTAKSVLRIIRRILPYRDCSVSKFQKYERIKSPCLYGHIGLCQAPCQGTSPQEDYKSDILKIRKLLSGNSVALLKSWKKQMDACSAKQDYESAQHYLELINKFNYVRQDFKSASKYIDNPHLVSDLRDRALNDLVVALPILRDPPTRIECYDISNISGTDSVGSMVVSIDGEIVKSEYRKFKIKTKNGPNDFAMINEVIYRRLKKDWDMPNLIVVDGGKGQLTSALDAMNALNVSIPLIGIAKRFETLIYFDGKGFVEVVLPRDNGGLMLIQRLRDEAHRFAQSYHHKLRLLRLSPLTKK